MSAAITCMHDDPAIAGRCRRLAERVGMSRSVFALRFKETVGATPMEYLTRWRMLLAGDRLTNSDDPISAIASRSATNPKAPSARPSAESWAARQRQHGRHQDQLEQIAAD